MTFSEYQRKAHDTAIYPDVGTNLIYTTFGLVGEAGEFANKLKKFYRDGILDHTGLQEELGDVLWYVAMCAFELGVSLEDIAANNLAKLSGRAERGVLGGSGDSR